MKMTRFLSRTCLEKNVLQMWLLFERKKGMKDEIMMSRYGPNRAGNKCGDS
jgi:hypothetical protein